jgi:voltage-gated potassium channel
MLSLILAAWRVIREIAGSAADPAFRRILAASVLLLISGTIGMYHIEGWSVIDSFYFSVIALTTVGFGDLTPQSDIGKLFTAFYVLGGIGVIVAFINALGERRLARSRHRAKHTS